MINEGFWNPNKEMFASILRIHKAQFSRCIEPSFQCTNRAIRAHSIQNAGILSQLVYDGHVIALTRSVSLADGPAIDFASVGRNQATTFTGLCRHHDQQIFEPIDTEEIQLDHEEHLFLLAYRTAYRELHATMDAAVKVQRGYLKRVEQGLDPKDTPTPGGMYAVERMIVSWMTWRYKSLLDIAHAGKDFAVLDHDVISLDVDRPTIAASSLFSVGHIRVRENDDVLRVHLNVLPLNAVTTAVVFSYLRSDAGQARTFLSHIPQSGGFQQRYEISRVILSRCENFVLAPAYFDEWAEEKKKNVRDYFMQTLFKADAGKESPDLYLF